MQLSIIIPTLNEQAHIGRLIQRLKEGSEPDSTEIVIVDGKSDDDTLEIARSFGVKTIECEERSRAAQLNLGANHATSDNLYFVHGDTLPPTSFRNDIDAALKNGYDMGCYRFKFESGGVLLKLNAFLTRFNQMWCRGGDQSLFIKRGVFEALGGFRTEYVIMEDFDLLARAKDKYKFCIMPKDILVSARKYENNHYFRVQFANLIVFNMFRRGCQPVQMLRTYRKLINHRS
ncbi:MAG: TIGR04283 family arsenosugar biosynthesis glycosyltransferase [Saprospiraceae bacterium]|nr:TIGR04283 family arsenosugar biosynthesis glycosyltransferase [Saprospiraceae bacterium]